MCQRRRGVRGSTWVAMTTVPLTFNESECRPDERKRGSARVGTETAVVRGQHGAAANEKEEKRGYSLFFHDPLVSSGF